jgi:tol-pal system protein YbgF
LLLRIDQLENQVRQLTGMIEQEQYRNQQLEAALRRMQEDYEYRFQQLGGHAGPRAAVPPRQSAVGAPPPGAIAPPPPPGAAPAPAPGPQSGRRSDAFDPAAHPEAPGAPRPLGSISSAAPPPRSEPPPGAAEEAPLGGRAPGAPLDLSTMAAPGEAPRPGVPPPRASGTTYAVATAPPSQSARDSFDLGYGYMQRKDFALAEETFRDFLKRFPADRLSSDAQYWLGESLYQRQSFRDAADAFLVMSKKYETSAKAPDALLRLGQSLAAINEKELACATLGEVLRKYPRASATVKQAVDREQKRVHC